MRRPTMSALAKEAGVGLSTVDRVINGRAPVEAATAQRVLEAAERIGYYATPLLRQRLKADVPQRTFGFLLQQRSTEFGTVRSPTYKPPQPSGLMPVLERNIEAICERRRRELDSAPLEQKAADAIASFTGSMLFVYLHLLLFGFWIIANLHWLPGVRAWDESFVVLAMFASVEAIFLSTFVLINQNRMAAAADQRA